MNESRGRFERRAFAIVGAVLLMGAAWVGAARGYSSGPPDGRCGDPPMFTYCTGCHATYALNSGDGAFTVSGLPDAYEPNQTYLLGLRLEDPSQRRWGFEFTAVNLATELGSGVLVPVNPTYVQVSDGGGDERDYLKQTTSGTFPNTDLGYWEVWWTAPPSAGGDAHFYFVGNAANNNHNSGGDYIYAFERVIPELVPSDAPELAAAERSPLELWPNPARRGDTVQLQTTASPVGPILLVDARGRVVRRLDRPAGGVHTQRLALIDAAGAPLAAGTYFFSLGGVSGANATRLVIVR